MGPPDGWCYEGMHTVGCLLARTVGFHSSALLDRPQTRALPSGFHHL
jgi:hypothetical protein